MVKHFDEVTGLWVEIPEYTEDEYWIVDFNSPASAVLDGTCYGFANTKAEAMRKQLKMGLRATTEILYIPGRNNNV